MQEVEKQLRLLHGATAPRPPCCCSTSTRSSSSTTPSATTSGDRLIAAWPRSCQGAACAAPTRRAGWAATSSPSCCAQATPSRPSRSAHALLELDQVRDRAQRRAPASGSPPSTATRSVADDLVVRADIALYEAKQSGGRRPSPGEGQRSERLAWVEQIREALEHDRLVLYSQPIVERAQRASVASEELLARLIDEHGDVIPPAAFLPTAERFGLISDIDRLVRATRRSSWPPGRQGLGQHLRPLARRRRDHRDDRPRGSQRGRSRPCTFEITETAASATWHEARGFAQRLETLGCRLALDDFGTGLQLPRLPQAHPGAGPEDRHGVRPQPRRQLARPVPGRT